MNKVKRELLRIIKQVANLPQRAQVAAVRINNKCRRPSYTSKPISKIIVEGHVLNSFKHHKNKISADIILICAFTERFDMISTAIKETLKQNTKKPLHIKWVLVGSTKKDFDFIAKISRSTKNVCGFLTQNSPLGGKWQAAVRAARQIYEAELFGIIGSDDIISNSLINHIFSQYLRDQREEKKLNLPSPSLFAPTEWIMTACRGNKLGPNIFRCYYRLNNYQQPLGAGRFYTKECLSSFNDIIFDGRKENNLDNKGWDLIKANCLPVAYYNLSQGVLASIKGPWESLNSADVITQSNTVCVEEYSFKGNKLLQSSFSKETFDFITE